MLTRFDYFKGYNEPKTPKKLIQIACKPLSNLMFSEAFHSTQTTCILNVSFQFAHVANLHQTRRSPRVYAECKKKRKLNVFSGFAREANFCKFLNLPTDLHRFAPLSNWQPPLLQQVCT